VQRARRLWGRMGVVGVAAAVVFAGAAAGPAGAVTGSAGRATGPAAAGSTAATAVSRGTAAVVGTSRMVHQPAGTPTAVRLVPLAKPASGSAAGRRSLAARSAPRAVSAGVTAGPVGTVLHSFDGVNAVDNKSASGFDLEPPDEGLAAGNGYVVNFVNVTGIITTTAGQRLHAPFYLNTFFGESAAANTSDPRVFYDASTRRWFATILEYGITAKGVFTESHVDIATSTAADPRAPWRITRIPTSNLNHAGCPCLADYPILGVDTHNVYVSTNEFSNIAANPFNGSQLYAVSKSQLVAGAPRANVVTYQDLSAGGALAYHVQPANTYGDPGVEYLMSSLDPNSTFDTRLAVWALTNPGAVTTGGEPTLSVTITTSEPYATPPNAQTPPGFCSGSICGKTGSPTTGVVATDFDAMQEVQYIHGNLVGALNTGVTVPGDPAERSGVAWFVVHPHVTGATIDGATAVTRQGYVSQNGEYLLYPHVNMTDSGAMAVVFGVGGPGTYLSAGYATAPAGHGFGQIHIAGAGVAPDNGFTDTTAFGGVGRWGDYSNGQIIPGTNKVWLATQYIPNNGDGNANWGHRVIELQLD